MLTYSQYKLPSSISSDVPAIVGFHLAVYLQWSSGSVDPVVPRWSSGVAVMYLLAGCGRVVFRDTFANDQLPHLFQNVFFHLLLRNVSVHAVTCVCVCVFCLLCAYIHMCICSHAHVHIAQHIYTCTDPYPVHVCMSV